eukprot:TRINITY_DN1715_c0_g1_i7.p1 TRINITY_DN1715_c0_g1~~TRINITY_DN1715_c0_g1_i7.p1  ORF type:complete len:122 (-),score=9.75 TRINITY_DN1715_c0_g1_i7:396-761(-)
MSTTNGILDDYRIDERECCKCEGNCVGSCTCSDSPINFECSSSCSCQFKECHNRKLQKGLATELEIRYISESKGFGVFSLSPIKANDFICEYIGELLSESQVSSLHSQGYLLHIREVRYFY